MARSDPFDPLLDKLGIDPLAFGDELGVRDDLIAVLLILVGGILIEDDKVDFSPF